MSRAQLSLDLTVPVESLDLPRARQERDKALANVEAHAPEGFAEAALEAVRRTALERATFIVDDVWLWLSDKPMEARVMGSVMRRARHIGYIEPTDTFQTSAQVKCHANPRRVWRSKIFHSALTAGTARPTGQ